MYYYISTNAYDYVATIDYWEPHAFKIFTVGDEMFDPTDYVMLSPRTKRRMKDYTLAEVEDMKKDLWECSEDVRDRAAELFIFDQFVRDPMSVSWDEVDGDIQDLLDGAEWYITVQA